MVLAKISTGPPEKVGQTIVPIVPGGVNPLIFNQLGPEQSLFHIVPHCSGPK
jgi:hypothetical protein